MHCVRGRSGVTEAAPPGPLSCILWAFSGVAAQGRREIHCKAAFWRRPPPFSGHIRAHGGLHSCAACQLSDQSTTQITALQHAPPATTNPAVFVRAAAASHPSSCSRTPPCAEAITHTSQTTPTAGPALNQIYYSHSRSCSEPNFLLRTISHSHAAMPCTTRQHETLFQLNEHTYTYIHT